MKIKLIGGDSIGWSIDEDRKNLENMLLQNKFELTNSVWKADSILFVWYDQLTHKKYLLTRLLSKLLHKKIYVIVTNEITEQKIQQLKKHIDVWICPSKSCEKLIQSKNEKTKYLPFYVSPKKFYKIKKSEALKSLKIPNKKYVGSFQRDTSEDLKTPKWQKNPELFAEVMKKLSKQGYTALIAGPRRHFLINKLKKEKIPYVYYGDETYISKNKDDLSVNNLSLEKINLLYNCLEFYLISSKSEGGPKAIIESGLNKTKCLSTAVGLAPDFLDKKAIYNTKEEAEAKNATIPKIPSNWDKFYSELLVEVFNEN